MTTREILIATNKRRKAQLAGTAERAYLTRTAIQLAWICAHVPSIEWAGRMAEIEQKEQGK